MMVRTLKERCGYCIIFPIDKNHVLVMKDAKYLKVPKTKISFWCIFPGDQNRNNKKLIVGLLLLWECYSFLTSLSVGTLIFKIFGLFIICSGLISIPINIMNLLIAFLSYILTYFIEKVKYGHNLIS